MSRALQHHTLLRSGNNQKLYKKLYLKKKYHPSLLFDISYVYTIRVFNHFFFCWRRWKFHKFEKYNIPWSQHFDLVKYCSWSARSVDSTNLAQLVFTLFRFYALLFIFLQWSARVIAFQFAHIYGEGCDFKRFLLFISVWGKINASMGLKGFFFYYFTLFLLSCVKSVINAKLIVCFIIKLMVIG